MKQIEIVYKIWQGAGEAVCKGPQACRRVFFEF